MRVAILSPTRQRLMRITPSSPREWIKERKAKVVNNDLGVFTVKLVCESSGSQTQPIAMGIDQGNHETIIGVYTTLMKFSVRKLQLLLQYTRRDCHWKFPTQRALYPCQMSGFKMSGGKLSSVFYE
ncbi:RRXRR domain-containing protein [Moorena producens JHB]|uniref:RRXRR domain-containing protein n=1 Tax=Moorena producens (strain JHB) TaxID=1454205 RepID=A0A1D9G910_MOOP1|nr:RRXRR domain-containing protein [Moorena producens]AOY84156.1 RRXRR domain-containing protein [Moorena producens JHB]